MKLVIVGDADHEDRYSMSLKERAGKNSNIVLTGFLTGKPLHELYSHAALFVLPSYYEGLPIALLEAMSYGLSCIASDIPAFKDILKNNENAFVFRVGNYLDLSNKITQIFKYNQLDKIGNSAKKYSDENWDWIHSAYQTKKVYEHYYNSKSMRLYTLYLITQIKYYFLTYNFSSIVKGLFSR